MKQLAIFKVAALATVSLTVLTVSSGAFAQSKTREQVYQELIQAQQNGLNYVTDSSYPEVNPIFAQQVQQHRAALSAEAAAVASGHSESGHATTADTN